MKIEVSLYPECPPLPSNLFVYCPDLDPTGGFTVLPRIVRAEENLFLLRVAVDCRRDQVSTPDNSDYFVYRATGPGTRSTREPSLRRLLRPHPSFHDDDVGLLSRGDHYTVAALMASGTLDVYDLHLFHSESEVWIYRKVSVEEPQRGFPLLIPDNCSRLLYHDTSTVIAIGGEGGTMGWVDLWRGILLCDVLRDNPALRGVPLPLPLELVSCNDGLGTELGCPKSIRGIAFIKGMEDCSLKLIHLEANTTQLPSSSVADGPSFLMHNWAIVTWSNTKMTSSWKDWHWGGRVEASDITMNSQIKSELLQSGLLYEPRDGNAAGRGLQNLLVSDPAPDISAAALGDVVYLMAREEFMHPKAWVLSLDLRNKTVLGAAEFGTGRQPSARVMYCPSTITKHMNT